MSKMRQAQKIALVFNKVFFPANVIIFGTFLLLFYLRDSVTFFGDAMASFSSIFIYSVFIILCKSKISDEIRLHWLGFLISFTIFLFFIPFFKLSWQLIFCSLSLFTTAITVYLIRSRWKISAHVTGVAFVSTVLTIIDPNYWWLFLSLPLVAWSRIQLGVHDIIQIITGGILGLFFPILLRLLFFHC